MANLHAIGIGIGMLSRSNGGSDRDIYSNLICKERTEKSSSQFVVTVSTLYLRLSKKSTRQNEEKKMSIVLVIVQVVKYKPACL